MSHVKCGPYPYSNEKDVTLGYIPDDKKNDFNREISEIAAEVEANNFDMFISVHSNADTEGSTTNYLYFAYDDDFTGNDKTLSIEMSRCAWNHRILDRHTQWSHYDYTMTAADVAAGKGKIGYQGLSVLNHSVPGYLVEGYFHTYQPARHRYMNFDMCRLEGVDYARGVADYFGWEKEKTGDIVGIVRDRLVKFNDELYSPKSNTYDVYKPLNGVVATLKKGGAVVATDTTDVNYNGLFAFRNLEPGDYTVEFAAEGYKDGYVWATDMVTEKYATSIAVTVKAAATSYPTAFIVNEDWEPAPITYVNYPDPLAGNTDFILAEEINFTDEYKNNTVSELEGKVIRRSIVRDNLQYILAFDARSNPYVYVYDTDSKALVKTLGTSATAGDIYKLSDIAMTADGYLVGINKANQAFDGAQNMIAYKWKNDANGIPDGELDLWWSNNFAGNWSNGIGGERMVYSGTLTEGKMIYTGTTTAPSGNTRLVIASISEGNYKGHIRNLQDDTYMSTTYMGTNFNMTLSPNADDQLIFNSANIQPFEIKLNEIDAGITTILGQLGDGILNKASTGESYFKYAGKSVMVAPDVDENGKVTAVELVDITNGLDKATKYTLTGTSVVEDENSETSASSTMAANAELSLTLDDHSGDITDAEIELFLTADGKNSKFTTKGVEQPVFCGVYAYNLEMIEDDVYTLSFYLNNKSANVDIVLVPTQGDSEEIVYELGALEAGKHSFEIDPTTISRNYTWKVSVANKSIVSGKIIATMNTWEAGSTYYRGGVAVETNPESEYFGTTYLAVGRSEGVFLLDPTYTVQEGAPYWTGKFNTGNASSTFRSALYNNKLYLSDWSDAYPGIWIFDPAKPTAINNIFAGATNDGNGKLSIDGVDVGGGSTGVAFTGNGANRKMFIYVEDLPTSNGGNKLYKYDIGAEDTWGAKEPVQLATASSKLINTNTGLLGSALHNVVFCSQTRNANQNNTNIPAFIVINEDGDIIFNGGDLEYLNGCLGGGMALNADETKFAIIDGSAKIQVYDVNWTDNVPSFTHYCSISTNDQEICQMAFDYSGNLHCINRKHGYYVHAVPNVARAVETPAKAQFVIKPVYPDAIYAIGNVGDYNWEDISQGVELDHQGDGVYSANVDVNDSGDGYGYLQFATTLGNTADDWDTVNSGIRYGALTADEAITSGEATSMTNDSGSDTQSWKAEANTYKMIVDIKNCTVTMTIDSTTGADSIDIDNNTPVVYYNLQGVEVTNPENGIFIKKQGNKVTKVYIK